MAKKYIDAGLLAQAIAFHELGKDLDSSIDSCGNEYLEIINCAPAADVAEVVMCKDCRYYLGLAVCKLMGTCGETAFCSKGEKIDGGDKW